MTLGYQEYVDMLKEDGFVVVRETMFASPYAAVERHVVMWKADEGLLATAESYTGKMLNSSHVHYNVLFDEIEDADGDSIYYSLISSGSFHKESFDEGRYLWVGDHSGRGPDIRTNLNRLRSAGKFQPAWAQRPWLNLLNYMEWKTVAPFGDDVHQRTEAVIAELPESVRTAITPAK